MAQKAELRGKINLDSSGFKRGIAQSKKSVGTFVSTLKGSLLPALGAAGAAGALVSFGRKAIESASQIKELSQVSGLGVVEFQKYAEAARTVNIEQDKLADIFKDTSDKMGDFLNTGGGAMADFFEKIAPLVGATKEEFIGLTGAESLQRYFNYLEEANIPHQEMVFYMEAIASDATMLIPLLKNGGEAFKELGEGAEAAGRIMDASTIEALDDANEAIDRFMQNVTIFTGQVIELLMPVKDELRELAIEQLRAEDAFAKGFFEKRIALFTGSDGDLIKQRVALLEKEREKAELVRMENEQNRITLAKIESIKRSQAEAAEKEAENEAKLNKIKEDAAKRQADLSSKINKPKKVEKNVEDEMPEAMPGFQDKSSEPAYMAAVAAGITPASGLYEQFVKDFEAVGQKLNEAGITTTSETYQTFINEFKAIGQKLNNTNITPASSLYETFIKNFETTGQNLNAAGITTASNLFEDFIIKFKAAGQKLNEVGITPASELYYEFIANFKAEGQKLNAAGINLYEDFLKNLVPEGQSPNATQKAETANSQLTVLNHMNDSLKTIEREMTR